MRHNTVALLAVSLVLLANLSITADVETPASNATPSATDLAEQWQPPGTRKVHMLGGGDRIAYMRLDVKAPLASVWEFYAERIGYDGDQDFSTIAGTLLDPRYVIIRDNPRKQILIIQSTDQHTVNVQIPLQEDEVIEGLLVTIGTR